MLAIPIKRCIPEPLHLRRAVRFFPRTDIKATARYIATIHAIENNKFKLKIDGLLSQCERHGDVELWRLRQVVRKLEETIKTTVPACEKHLRRAHGAQCSIKGTQRGKTRTIGGDQMREGWKGNNTFRDGTLEIEIEFGVNQAGGGGCGLTKYAFDTKVDDGTVINHILYVELLVSMELTTENRPHATTLTGISRRLSMNFGVTLTNFSSTSISWDNETPPTYGDVPPSPPSYFIEDHPID
jgi:hypothetical protein